MSEVLLSVISIARTTNTMKYIAINMPQKELTIFANTSKLRIM